MKNFLPVITAICLLCSCSVNKPILKQAKYLLKDSAINTGHMGISIYEPATGKYWYNYNADHYFIPASNTKLFSLYAGMKYLGDSLVGGRYRLDGNMLFIHPSGDPSFLHPEFNYQPFFDIIKNLGTEIYISANQQFTPLGNGWAWNDFDENYFSERSAFPMYGNLVWISAQPLYPKNLTKDTLIDSTKYLKNRFVYIKPKYFAERVFESDKTLKFSRKQDVNKFFVNADSSFSIKTIPFITDNNTQTGILEKITGKKVMNGDSYTGKFKTIHSQPTDSLFKPMMHRSDNFFAEQTLLMVSNELLGYMSDEKIIDTILRSSLKDVPQKPKWVDGSGLSRYNLFTPQSFVYILHKMKEEFGMERMKLLLPTGGEGTLSAYYKKESGFIYAKTGTLSNNCALSGYLITKKGKLLIFSILNNNYITGATPVRRAVERFLQGIREKN